MIFFISVGIMGFLYRFTDKRKYLDIVGVSRILLFCFGGSSNQRFQLCWFRFKTLQNFTYSIKRRKVVIQWLERWGHWL